MDCPVVEDWQAYLDGMETQAQKETKVFEAMIADSVHLDFQVTKANMEKEVIYV